MKPITNEQVQAFVTFLETGWKRDRNGKNTRTDVRANLAERP